MSDGYLVSFDPIQADNSSELHQSRELSPGQSVRQRMLKQRDERIDHELDQFFLSTIENSWVPHEFRS